MHCQARGGAILVLLGAYCTAFDAAQNSHCRQRMTTKSRLLEVSWCFRIPIQGRVFFENRKALISPFTGSQGPSRAVLSYFAIPGQHVAPQVLCFQDFESWLVSWDTSSSGSQCSCSQLPGASPQGQGCACKPLSLESSEV